jgi:hypothetical protein
MGRNSKIEKLKKELEETKIIMVDNVDKVIARGQKLEKLKDKSHDLVDKSRFAMKNAKKLKSKMYWRNVTWTVITAASAIGGIYALLSGFGWPMILASSALTGLLSYGVVNLVSEIQQTKLQFPFANASKSLGKQIKALTKKGLKLMKPNNKSSGKLTPAEEEAKLIAQINADLDETKKQEVENTQKLIERGSKLQQLTTDTSKLSTVTENLKTDAHKLERVEEARSNHYTSILVGFGGFAVGALYGFFTGYAWPMMLVFGALAGTFAYGLSSLVTGVEEKVTSIGDSFKPLAWLKLAKSAGKEEKLLHSFEKTNQFSPQFSRQLDKRKEVEDESRTVDLQNTRRKILSPL